MLEAVNHFFKMVIKFWRSHLGLQSMLRTAKEDYEPNL